MVYTFGTIYIYTHTHTFVDLDHHYWYCCLWGRQELRGPARDDGGAEGEGLAARGVPRAVREPVDAGGQQPRGAAVPGRLLPGAGRRDRRGAARLPPLGLHLPAAHHRPLRQLRPPVRHETQRGDDRATYTHTSSRFRWIVE